MPRSEAGDVITGKLTLFAASDFALQPRNGLLLLLHRKLCPLPGELPLSARVDGAQLRRAQPLYERAAREHEHGTRRQTYKTC